MALKRSVAVARKAQTPLAESPARESKSHGQIENAITLLQANVRVLRKYLENSSKANIPNGHPIIDWPMRLFFAADVLNLFHQTSHTGRPAYEEVIQHKPKDAVAGFGLDRAHHGMHCHGARREDLQDHEHSQVGDREGPQP